MEPDHKELLIGLIGSTYGDMKRIDDSIVGSSTTLTRRSDQVKTELTNMLKGIVPKADVPALQLIQQQQQQLQQQEQQMRQMQMQPPAPPEGAVNLPFIVPVQEIVPVNDTSQLEFDLNKATRYEDIVDSLDRIVRRIDNLEIMLSNINEKLDNLTKNGSTVLKNKKKIPGIVESSDYNQE
jgi:exonuclease VII small subunit